MHFQLQPKKIEARKAILAVYIAAKDVLPALYCKQDELLLF